MTSAAKGNLTLDFETQAIEPLPNFPPKPGGFAYSRPECASILYHGWDHPTGNNFQKDFHSQRGYLAQITEVSERIICHNAAFDGAVLADYYHLPVWKKLECTMVLAFLHNPHGELALKPLSAELLKLPPDEQEELRLHLEAKGYRGKQWGAHIMQGDGQIVGKYAKSDVDRTEGIFPILYKDIKERGMVQAYEREMRLMPHIHHMAKHGVHVNVDLLRRDTNDYFEKLEELDERICTKIGDVDIDADASLAEGILKAGLAPQGLPTTPTGKLQVNKDSLIEYVSDKELVGLVLLRNSIATSLRTFMSPWLAAAQKQKGKIYFTWNQVRNYSDTGARTGRMSSSPNAQNIPAKWEKLEGQFKNLGFEAPFMPPNVRQYIVASPGCKLIGLDYSQQEIRLLAHFADGILMQEYQKNPLLDPHKLAADLSGVSRKVAKTIAFASIYGAGTSRIAEQIGCSYAEAQEFRRAYYAALPDVPALQKKCQAQGGKGQAITTIGGRQYYVEPPKIVKGRMRSFEYKLTNYLIQGSAADQTKEAMVNYLELPFGLERQGDMIIQVHDQLVAEVPEAHAATELELLRSHMVNAFSGILDVPFIVDGAIGDNFAEV